MDLRTHFSHVGQLIWHDCTSKKLVLSVISAVALAIFELIIRGNPVVLTDNIVLIVAWSAVTLAISFIVYPIIFFKTKQDDSPLPKWLDNDQYYELDSLVTGKKDLAGPQWSQYSYYKLCLHHCGQPRKYESQSIFKCIKEAADRGEPQAKFKLAICYEKGIGCQHDLNKAFEVLKEAEDSLNQDILVKLGVYYFHLKNDPDKAIELWELAAYGENGHPYAKILVAKYYEQNFKHNPSPELAKKIITYHRQIVEHPSKIGQLSSRSLVFYCNSVITAVNSGEYERMCNLKADPTTFSTLTEREIQSYIFIWGAGLRRWGDAVFRPTTLKDSLRDERDKYSRKNLVNEHYDLREKLLF